MAVPSATISPECPIDPYGIAKQAVEIDLKAASEIFDLHYTIFRPYNVYGPGQNLNDPYRNVVGIFIRKALLGEPLTIFGDGLQTRCFTYIDDVAPRIAHSIEHRDMLRAIADIGSRKPLTVLSIARKIIELTGSKSQIVHLPPRKEVKEAWAGMTPYSGYTEFDAGIQKMIDWARTQELRDPQPFAEIEIEKNLPEAWRKLYEH
jgi:UDP-glucose 4-epimerase